MKPRKKPRVRKPRVEIEHVLVCSTAHITIQDNTLLQGADTPANVTYTYGYYIYVGYDLESLQAEATQQGFSAAFVALLALPRKYDCTWLKLDADGTIMDNVPTFDW
jgi:hypothetical protein